MGREINAANDYAIQIFEELSKNYIEFNFQFGASFYRDKIDSKKDKNEYFPLTTDMETFKKIYLKLSQKEEVIFLKIGLKFIKWQ